MENKYKKGDKVILVSTRIAKGESSNWIKLEKSNPKRGDVLTVRYNQDEYDNWLYFEEIIYVLDHGYSNSDETK